MDTSTLDTALTGDVVNLANVASAFGAGAIASSISGNPFYSQDPAATGYATGTGVAPTAAASGSGLIVLLILGYFLLKG